MSKDYLNLAIFPMYLLLLPHFFRVLSVIDSLYDEWRLQYFRAERKRGDSAR